MQKQKTANPIKLSLCIFSTLFIVTLLSAFALLKTHVSADELPTTSASTTASVSVSTACSLAATGTTHSGTLTPGQFTGDIGTSNFTATCNDPGGYAIYAVGYSGDEWKNTNLIGSGDIGNIATDPDAGHKTSGDTSYWYMKLAQGGGDKATIVSPYNDYASIPSDYTKVAAYASNTAGTNGTSFTSTYGAYIASGQTPGTYTGKVKYTLVNPQNADAPEAKDPSFDDAYAAAGKTKYNGYSKLQDMSSDICSAVAIDQITQLIDARDNTVYNVSKLADDRCWFLDNMALDLVSVSLVNLQGNTNASNTTLSYLKNGGGTSPYTTTAVANKTSGFTSYNSPYINAASKNRVPSGAMPGSKGTNKVGIYYNYCAASAGSYCYSESEGVGDASEDICPAGWRIPTGGFYTYDAGKGEGEFYNLGIALGLTFDEEKWGFTGTTYQTILSVPLSGIFYNSTAFNQGEYGNFWSSSIHSSDGSVIVFTSAHDEVYPALADSESGGSARHFGMTIRCIAK